MKTLDLETLMLASGAHDNPESGMCVMEAVAFVAGEPFSDHPKCACPTLGAFLRSWNDSLDEATRQKLKPYIPRLVGTNDGNSERRTWMCVDWLSRECTPAFLDLAGLSQHSALRALPEIKDLDGLKSAQPVLDAAREAAGDAAWDAAWVAARAAAGDAAWAAAREAAREAARAAAWDAAWVAAWVAARDAAVAAAKRTLAPVVEKLQASAFKLIDRMLALPKVIDLREIAK